MATIVKGENQLVSLRELISINSLRITIWIGQEVSFQQPFHVGGYDDALVENQDFEVGGYNNILNNIDTLQTGNE